MPNSGQQWIDERVALLRQSADEELEAAATELAVSDDPAAIERLVDFLAQRDFLERLDPPGSTDATERLRAVLSVFKERPGPDVAHASLRLADAPYYLEHDRKSLVLEAMAAAVPMTAEVAAAFDRANEEGYFGFNALLLAKNGSPAALDLFHRMMQNSDVEIEERVEFLHKGILPFRTRLATLQMVSAMLDDNNLDAAAKAAAIESVFDYRPEWFGHHGAKPPAWRSASDETLEYVIALGTRVLERDNRLQPDAVRDTIELATALLAARRR
jgi:hypothetical protein